MEDFDTIATADENSPEIKKPDKLMAAVWVLLGAAAVLLGTGIYLKVTGKVLFLFGNLWDMQSIANFTVELLFLVQLILLGKRKHDSAGRTLFIVAAVCAVLYAALLIYGVCSLAGEKAAHERLTMPDGREVLLWERTGHTKIIEKTFELTYLDVYGLSGITAEKLGEIDETYFSNKCLSQGKYSYEYDEADRRLTIVCEYGEYGDSVVRLKKEYDTGFWEEEFILP